ncbi:MAG: ubiquinol-cytochrome c reductase iron-sulfur subunit [Chloroflexota bacterium]
MAEPKSELSRRDFLQYLGVLGGVVVSGGGVLFNAVRYVLPVIKVPQFVKLRAASLEQLADGQALEFTPMGQRIVLLRQEDEVRAVSGICTHLGCQVKWEEDNNRFFCPCHLGVFDEKGQVVSGPPPGPLQTYQVEVAGGSVYVYVPDKRPEMV